MYTIGQNDPQQTTTKNMIRFYDQCKLKTHERKERKSVTTKRQIKFKIGKNMIKGQNQIIKIETNKHAKRMKPNHQN